MYVFNMQDKYRRHPISAQTPSSANPVDPPPCSAEWDSLAGQTNKNGGWKVCEWYQMVLPLFVVTKMLSKHLKLVGNSPS